MRAARFVDKVALVTGSGRGIGRAIAVRLASEGVKIIINDLHDNEDTDETIRLIKEAGSEAKLVLADISKSENHQVLIEKSVQAFGKLDILVNNAGVEIRAPFCEVTEQQYDTVMNVNLKAMFFITQHFANYIRSKNIPGTIVNISSVHEELPFPNFASYCASKGGMLMMMRTLAVELAAFNIRINNVAPGAIKTSMNSSLLKNVELLNMLKNNISLGRLGEPEDVAAVVAFLASDDAKYVTGSTYYVDGGLIFHYVEQ